MQERFNRRNNLKLAAEYFFAALLCLVILVVVMKLWRADFRVTFENGGDTLFHGMIVKGMIENGWYTTNPRLGMPGGMELYDFPVTENFHMLVMKVISVVTHDYALVLNLYFVLTFPLTTLAALYVFRRFGVSYATGLLCSLLYAFLPFHFLRNQHHLFLAAYYMIPLMTLVVLWVGENVSFFSKRTGRDLKSLLLDRKFIFSLVVCAIIGSSGVYYPFFSCFLLLVAGGAAALKHRSAGPLVSASLLVAVTVLFVLINLAPSIIYMRRHGETVALKRVAGESEVYGLKIAQLLLPVTNHRIRALADLKARYNRGPLINENDNVTLGLIGSCGFLFLIGRLFYRRTINEDMEKSGEVLDRLSMLNLAAVLLATIGGFGTLFALFVSPRIRTYNRISIFVAFFSLFALALLIEGLARRFIKSERMRAAFLVGLVVLGTLGILDQTPRTESYRPNFDKIKSMDRVDAEFFRRVESDVPPRSMIFQLPVAYFPEQGPIERMGDYSHLRGYFHTNNLRWSFGAIRGRETARWQEALTMQPWDEFVKNIAFVGFDGIYLDREGYADNGAAVESELSTITNVQPLESSDGKLLFFNLVEYRRRLKEEYTPDEWEARRQLALRPPVLNWLGGFSDLEKAGDNNWRWCSSQGELQITNNSPQPTRARLEMSLATGYDEYSNLRIESPFFSETMRINQAGQVLSKEIEIPTGTHTISFISDAPRVNAPRDARVLVFKVMNFKLRAIL